MPAAFECVAPVLPVRNVAEALKRYRRLGFQTRPYLEPGFSTEENPSYGYLTWGQVEIHLSGFDQLDPKTTTSVCYLFVDDAEALYAEWITAGVEGRFRQPVDTSYGKREFGYVLSAFGLAVWAQGQEFGRESLHSQREPLDLCGHLRVLLDQCHDIDEILPSLARTPARLLRRRQLQDHEVRWASQAQRKPASVDDAGSSDGGLDSDILRRELDGNALGARTLARRTPIVAVRVPTFVNETRSRQRFARDIRERLHRQVDVQRGSRLPRIELHRDPADDGIGGPCGREHGSHRSEGLLFGVTRRKSHRLSPKAIEAVAATQSLLHFAGRGPIHVSKCS